MRSVRVLPGAAALALALAGCGARPGAAPRAAAAPDTAGPPIVRATADRVLARVAAPGARATLVNVWASWCGPCRAEMPALLRVMRRHSDARLLLVSADFDAQEGAARHVLRDLGVTDTTFLKAGGDQAFIDALAPEWSGALPATLVYDARGTRVAFWEGAGDSARFEDALARAERTPTAPEGTR